MAAGQLKAKILAAAAATVVVASSLVGTASAADAPAPAPTSGATAAAPAFAAVSVADSPWRPSATSSARRSGQQGPRIRMRVRAGRRPRAPPLHDVRAHMFVLSLQFGCFVHGCDSLFIGSKIVRDHISISSFAYGGR
ncbi:hypothetical protein C2845_PM07G24910 [Panicum miliaceum]|uniref:Uncharacterized protein n=1 Tax=Panicum miliaceum TaxID=4540 RepID=A0A3L6SN66_PANMI|nr:hypothetical protein C2845_PM07G24910 [Panicum miliaceum]